MNRLEGPANLGGRIGLHVEEVLLAGCAEIEDHDDRAVVAAFFHCALGLQHLHLGQCQSDGADGSHLQEVASRDITVNSIAPGFIDTDMTRDLDSSQTDALRQQIPAGRLGTPEDIAAAVVFLASDAGAYITGETLNINGGLAMI